MKDNTAVENTLKKKADLLVYKSEIMSDEVEVDTRQIYLIPSDGSDGMQNTEVSFMSFTLLWKTWTYRI